MYQTQPPRSKKPPLQYQPRQQPQGFDLDERIVPYNVEAEEAVLGSILLDSQALIRVASFLTPADFFREKNRWAYEAAIALYTRGEAIDFLMLRDEMERRKTLEEAGGASFLTSLLNSVPTSIHIEHYGRIVERCAVRRRMIDAGVAIVEAAYEEDDLLEESIRKGALAYTEAVKRQTTGVRTAHDIIQDMSNAETQTGQAVSTGYSDLDRITTGLRPGKLYIVGGRPGMGKSALMLNIAHNVLERGVPVLVVSLEMEEDEVIQRIKASRTRIDLMRITTGEVEPNEMHRLIRAEMEIDGWPLEVLAGGSLTVDKVASIAAVAHARTPYGLIVVDYLQLMAQGNPAQRVALVGEVSRGLKRLAKDLRVPVMAASSLSRAVESRQDRRPVMSDLRESGDIESDADQIWLLLRPKYYDPTSTDSTVEVNVAKHRNGKTGPINLYYHEEWTRFDGLDRGGY